MSPEPRATPAEFRVLHANEHKLLTTDSTGFTLGGDHPTRVEWADVRRTSLPNQSSVRLLLTRDRSVQFSFTPPAARDRFIEVLSQHVPAGALPNARTSGSEGSTSPIAPYIAAGIALWLVGSFVAAVSTTGEGSRTGLVIGALVAAAGTLCLFVAIIAKGVELGIRAARVSPSTHR